MTRDVLALCFLLSACSTSKSPARAVGGVGGLANSASSSGAGGRVADTATGGIAGSSQEAETSADAAADSAAASSSDAAVSDAAVTPSDAATLDATDSDATAPSPFDAASCIATAPPEATTVAQALAQALSLTTDKVQIACVEEVSWPSGCLGLPAPELCAPGPVPGYQITLRALDSYYVYHTSKMGAWLYASPGDQPRAP